MIFKPALLVAAAVSVWAAADPGLAQIKSVYLMPMSHGLDQYLANKLTEERVFEVVTDPSLADAVLTDRIGRPFEEAFADLYPPPPPPEPPPAKEADEKNTKKRASSSLPSLVDRPETPRMVSTFSRGRGNVFLVDRKTRRVIWSEYVRPRNSRPDELNRVADRLIDRLQDRLDELRKGLK
jgi:hypothetical protein